MAHRGGKSAGISWRMVAGVQSGRGCEGSTKGHGGRSSRKLAARGGAQQHNDLGRQGDVESLVPGEGHSTLLPGKL